MVRGLGAFRLATGEDADAWDTTAGSAPCAALSEASAALPAPRSPPAGPLYDDPPCLNRREPPILQEAEHGVMRDAGR